jgi:hypothetical protein
MLSLVGNPSLAEDMKVHHTQALHKQMSECLNGTRCGGDRYYIARRLGLRRAKHTEHSSYNAQTPDALKKKSPIDNLLQRYIIFLFPEDCFF